MYKSPITIIESTIDSFTKSIIKKKDDAIFAEIQHSFGVDMDKEELIRALQYDRDQYEKGYADGKADATQKWIPVTERLPEKGGSYLVFSSKSKTVFTAHYWLSDRWSNRANGQFITHWMPLPQPPKGE